MSMRVLCTSYRFTSFTIVFVVIVVVVVVVVVAVVAVIAIVVYKRSATKRQLDSKNNE